MRFCRKCGKEYADDAQVCVVDGTALTSSSGTAELPAGATFAGRYQIIEKIGQGGMGAVYKALHTRMNRVCAIKVLGAEQAEGHAAVERFNREAQMASRIDNPHAVVIYDFGETEDAILYLVMEYVEGESLGRALFRERTFTPQRACRVACQIAEALGAAHALGIVHRDLKPDNVMLAARGAGADFVKVLDFGIAKTVSHDAGEDLTQTGFVLGTPAYMSPEQLSGEKLDPRSDIYSLALIAYQMVSGKLPFEGENTQARLVKRLLDAPVPLRANAPGVSAQLEAAVMSGLARNREDRPASVALFARALDACIAGLAAADSRVESAPASTESAPTRPIIGVTGGGLGEAGGAEPRATAPQSGPTGADSLPTIPVGAQVTAPGDPPADLYGSPSSYVTQQSTTPMVSESSGSSGRSTERPPEERSAGVGQLPLDASATGLRVSSPPPLPDPRPGPAGQADRDPGQPLHVPTGQGPTAPPETVQVASAGHPPATRINPRQAPGPQAIPATAVQPAQKAGSGKKGVVGIILAVMAIGLLLVAGGGVAVYWIYFRKPVLETPRVSQGPPVNPQSAPTEPPSMPSAPVASATDMPLSRTAGNPEAAAHYAAGRRHQEQAGMLKANGTSSGSREEASKAIDEYRHAIQLQPIFPEAHENLGVALYNTGRVHDALGEYKTAIDQYADLRRGPTPQVLVNYGLALFDSKRYREAADAFGRALGLDPTDHDLYVHRGFALQNAGDYESAKQDYNRYLRLEPSGQYALTIKEILAGRAHPPSEARNK